TRPTMTGLLDGLAKDGLIKRSPHKNDRRKKRLKLTGKGKDLLEYILPDYWTRVAKLMAGLDEKERASLISLLNKVTNGIPELTRQGSD
ncbi:MAG: MarR family transcriptional regulator, partial [Desulfobacteraceae bacterium]|nr:MarR family transcriptional regulator [Desulfobacteraceae bacterium]